MRRSHIYIKWLNDTSQPSIFWNWMKGSYRVILVGSDSDLGMCEMMFLWIVSGAL